MGRKSNDSSGSAEGTGHVVRERTRAHSRTLAAIPTTTTGQKAAAQEEGTTNKDGMKKRSALMKSIVSRAMVLEAGRMRVAGDENHKVSLKKEEPAKEKSKTTVSTAGPQKATAQEEGTTKKGGMKKRSALMESIMNRAKVLETGRMKAGGNENQKVPLKKKEPVKEKGKTAVNAAGPQKAARFEDPWEQSIYDAAIAHLKRKADAEQLKKEKKIVPAKTQTQAKAPETTKAFGKAKVPETPKTTNNAVPQDAPRSMIVKLKLTYYPNGKRPEGEKSSVTSDPASSNQLSSSPSKARGSMLAAQGGHKIKPAMPKADIPLRVPGPKTTFIRGSRSNQLNFSRPVRAVEQLRTTRFAMRPQGTKFFDGTWTEQGRNFASGYSDSSGLSSPPPSSPPSSAPLSPQKRKRHARVHASSDDTEDTDGDETLGHAAKRVKMT